ncbi:integrase family protein (plasmid) [Crinalium epipsammum PCC 9333]|uniref:Integrase family protein n=1 Tax=Crinalium epipsammum PCC 9333 TaxID=1173022 RepID=K9W708_9CYAN|nr:tyrosine-type recombinase/integrase [Crinalium epipsammum]AFZ15569.1 integrase family protein [Crinalium epipsammum PCC 9333]
MKDNSSSVSSFCQKIMAAILKVLTDQPKPLAKVDHDAKLLELWLHGKSLETQKAYIRDIKSFLNFVSQSIVSVTLTDIQNWDNQMIELHLASATRARRLSAVKSLLSFGCKIGVLQVNVGLPVSTPAIKDTIAERILTEAEWLQIITNEPNRKHQLMLQMLYETRARVREFCALKWKDFRDKGDGTATVTLFGKGGKTRTVTITPELWTALQAIRNGAIGNAPVFLSQRKKQYSTVQAWRIVKAAGERAGINGISPHWLRHTGATHQLMNGSPIHVQQRELGHAGLDVTSRYLHLIPGEYGAKYTRVRLPMPQQEK